MEETDKSELTMLKRYIQAELELIGCKEISILTIPIKNTGSTDSNEKNEFSGKCSGTTPRIFQEK